MVNLINGQKKLKNILDNYEKNSIDISYLIKYRKYLNYKLETMESMNNIQSTTSHNQQQQQQQSSNQSSKYYELPLNNDKFSLFTIKPKFSNNNLSIKNKKDNNNNKKKKKNSSTDTIKMIMDQQQNFDLKSNEQQNFKM